SSRQLTATLPYLASSTSTIILFLSRRSYDHSSSDSFFFPKVLPPPISPLFPYTTLFRSLCLRTLPLFASYLKEELVYKFAKTLADSEEHTSELQSPYDLVCRLLLEKKKKKTIY